MEGELKYWEANPGTAPIKPEFVLWDKLKSGRWTPAKNDDDSAEGRKAEDKPQRSAEVAVPQDVAVPAPAADASIPATTSTSTDNAVASTSANTEGQQEHQPPSDGGDQPAPKKVRLSGAEKKKLARERAEIEWQRKKAAKAAAKEAKKNGLEVPEEESEGRKKMTGQNKGRKFHRSAGVDNIRLCTYTATGRPCTRIASGVCKWSHDLSAYLLERSPDVPTNIPISSDDLTPVEAERICPAFTALGACPMGFKCRFGKSHMRKVVDGEGVEGSGWELVVNEEKVREIEALGGEGLKEIRERGEFNVIYMDMIKSIRGAGSAKEDRFPLSTAYLHSIGEPLEREDRGHGKKGGKGGRGGKQGGQGGRDAAPKEDVYVAEDMAEDEVETVVEPTPAETATAEDATTAMDVDPLTQPDTEKVELSTSTSTDNPDIDSHPSRNLPDLAPIRATEKRRLNFTDKLYLAPLTTVGNLPFRRLCGDFGNDISCSEMGLAQEFLGGNASEWSLVRRHPSEKTFGVQICGSRPQALVPAAEALAKNVDIDFLDVNCGCPIDLVFNKGAGSALLQHATKLGKSLVGMSKVLGDIPLTIKIRNGVVHSAPVAHRLVTKFQTEWGLSAMTIHGRSRQQRYKTKADYAYVREVAQSLRDTAKDNGMEPIPIFGNGDAYDYRTYYENKELSGVDGIMIARGALIKPWIFTEIKERRDWDISSRERLDMIGKLAQYGLEHWGTDTMGLNNTRRFLCEALSFQHRYVPVGLLERLPMQLNERAFPYKGRDELETLLASDQSSDWVKISEMFLGPPPEDWNFLPKHKANAAGDTETQG